MSQHYSDPKRADEPGSLPDIETFEAMILRCPVCEAEYPDLDGHDDSCCHLEPLIETAEDAWWWWTCSPGCLPDSDPLGPFTSEEEALEDARYEG